MTREEILKKLATLPYKMVSDSGVGDWSERPFKVCSEGCGYVYADEMIGTCIGRNVSKDKYDEILNKVRSQQLFIKDIRNTPFYTALTYLIYDDWEDEANISDYFKSLLQLSGYYHFFFCCVFCLGDEICFYDSEKEMLDDYHTYWVNDSKWDEMSDEDLISWYNYLFDENGNEKTDVDDDSMNFIIRMELNE